MRKSGAKAGRDRTESYHHGQLPEALKSAALEILAERGAKALTFRELAQKTGVTHTAPYSHYKNKDALLAALATDGFHKLVTRIEAAAEALGTDPLLRLAAPAEGYLTFALEDSAYHGVVFGSDAPPASGDPDLAAADEAAFEFVRSFFVAAQDAGIVRDFPTDKLTTVLWATFYGSAEIIRNGTAAKRGIADRDELIHLLLDILFFGLAPRS